MNESVELIFCDNPHATRLTLHILSAVAESEAASCSLRTKIALAQAKARGVRLGGSRSHMFSPAQRMKGSSLGSETRRVKALERAAAIIPIIGEIKAAGRTTLAAIASQLNQRGIPTATGKANWYPQTVSNVLSVGV